MNKKKQWQPMQVGEKRDDEVTVYTFAIPLIGMNKSAVKLAKWFETFDGYLGLRPEYPFGTFLIFDTENHAKAGKNMCKFKDIPVRSNIGKCYIPEADFKEAMERKKNE